MPEVARPARRIMIITPQQCRAARAWLGWSQTELAGCAHVALTTVKDFEKGKGTPIAATTNAIRRTVEEAGIQLLFRENCGVEGIAEKKRRG